MKRRTKVGWIAVAAFVGLCAFSVWYTFRETYGVGVDSLWWLPPEAHNVTYYANGLTRVAEFLQDSETEIVAASVKSVEEACAAPAEFNTNGIGVIS